MLSVLKGMTVKEVETVNDYLTLLFNEEGDTGIHVYNNNTINAKSPYDLMEKTIQDVIETNEDLRITFSDGTRLVIGMREDDYNGPESLIYFAGGSLFFVKQ